jgi:hypothetical protein
MKYILFISCTCFLFSCSDSFVNHKLKYEKLGDCAEQPTPVKMISNMNGQRYEFTSCLDESFDGKNYAVERKGDSIIVSFPKKQGSKKQAFKLVLDIDAKPGYGHIILDDQELSLVSSGK